MRGTFFIFILLVFAACNHTEPPKVEKDTAPADTTVKHTDSIAVTARYKVLDSIFHSFQKLRNFNGTVLIAQGGHIIYEGAFGYANLEKKDTLTLGSTFQLASVSKQFTAASIMILQERGLLKYNDPVEKYIPEFPYKGITIWHLLTHRSGLSNYMYFCEETCTNKDTILSCEDVICIMEQQKPKEYYKPDTHFNYNNTNYMLLAAIVERISHMKFPEFAQKNIFEPLGMKSTFINDRSKPLSDKVCTGYYSVTRKAEDNYLDGVVGDKEVYSTVGDLYLWDQALYIDKPLKQNTLQEAWTPHSKERKNGHNYGYGWRLWTLTDSTKVVYHNGWWHGFNSNFIRIPGDTITIIVLRNLANRSFHFYDVPEILKVLKPEKYDPLFPETIEGKEEEQSEQ